MNPVILSNQASPLKTLLHSTSSYQPYTYSVRSNAPNSTQTRVKVPSSIPLDANSFGQQVSFTVPRYGLWQSACMKFKIKVFRNATNQRFSNWLGCFLASAYALSSHNKLICQLDSENLLHEATYGVDANERKSNGLIYMEEANWALYKGRTEDNDGTKYREVTVLVPLPFTFMQNTGSYLDTSFCEQLTVGCKLTSAATDLMLGGGKSWEFMKAELICDFVSLEDKERRAVQAANYSMTKPLTLLTTSYFREASKTFTVGAADTAASAVSLDIRCNALTECTYWRIIETTTGSKYNKGRALPPAWVDYASSQQNVALSTASHIGPSSDAKGDIPDLEPADAGKSGIAVPAEDDSFEYIGWTSYAIHASGVQIVEMESDELLLGWGGRSSRAISAMTNNSASSALAVVSESEQYLGSTDGFQTASWAADAKKAGGAYDSGSMSYRMLVHPQLTVKLGEFTADGGKDRTFELQCMHRCLNLTSVSSSDGRITQSVSI
jgi:hypothetical protein